MYRRAVVWLSLGFAPSLGAQAPRISPEGDPSVKADTIYSLAVKPADRPEERAVFLLDDGVVRFEADGRSSATFRQVVQILKEEAAEGYREQSFGYAPGHERLTINWIRVVKSNGEVVSAKPSHVQDSDVPAQMGDPVYSDRKVRRVSLTGVEPGSIVDYSYTREELKPFLPGDFFQSWGVSTGLGVMRSRFIVDVPAMLPLRIHEENLDFSRRKTEANGRVVYTWATGNLPRLKSEAYAADSNGVYMSVLVASPTTWQDIGRWYATNARGRYTLGPAAATKVASLVAHATSRDDSIRAVHKWVAQDIRYVSIALGLGGYQPRMPDSVVATGFGDCKDKATLFVAALAKLGITAYPVILNSDGAAKRDLPSIDQLDHAIAAVETPGRYQFVDLTSEFTPYGELPPAEQGALALVVHPDGRTEELSMPRDSATANRSETRITGVLSPDGTFNGQFEQREFGDLQYNLRETFAEPLDSTRRAGIANSIASNSFEGAEGDSLVGFDGKDLTAMPRLRVLIKHGKATTSAGPTEIFTLPMGSMSGMLAAAKRLTTAPKRRFPIDAEKVFGNRVMITEFRMTVPPGWKAQLPPNVTASSEFGTYTSAYAQTGNELRISRRSEGRRGVYPPDQVTALADWFRAMGRDDAKMIVFTK